MDFFASSIPEWLSAVASCASAIVVIKLATLNESHLRESQKNLQRQNRKMDHADFAEISSLIESALHALAAVKTSLDQKNYPNYRPDEVTKPILEATSRAASAVPRLRSAGLNLSQKAIEVSSLIILLNALRSVEPPNGYKLGMEEVSSRTQEVMGMAFRFSDEVRSALVQ